MITLPYPATLSLPLFYSTPIVAEQDDVVAGQLIARGGANGIDVVSPINGRVIGYATRPIANGDGQQRHPCLILQNTSPAPPPANTVKLSGSYATVPAQLKAAGILGLGGGGFPAWRKWRENLKHIIINGMESDSLVAADTALLQSFSLPSFISAMQVIADAFTTPLTVALKNSLRPDWQHPLIKHLPASYAIGNEHLLIEAILGHRLPDAQTPADSGVVSFNVGTAVAIAAALTHRTPQTHRIITVHLPNCDPININVPLGATVADIKQHLACQHLTLHAQSQPLPDESVIHATTLYLSASPPAAAHPPQNCIRCGHCAPVCPSQLLPWHLLHLINNQQESALNQHRLSSCLLCRRCDEVCPSHIPLTALFQEQQQKQAKRQQQQWQQQQWQHRYHQHTRRQQKDKTDKNWAKPHQLKSLLENNQPMKQ